MSFCGKVKTTEIGWICVIVTIGVLRAGLRDVADVDLANAGHAIDRGRDAGVAELGLCIEYRGLVGSNARLQLADLDA